METLEQLKEIYGNSENLDSATGFIQVKNSVYYTKIVNGVLFEYLESHSSWVKCQDFDDVDSIRSLSDIKLIIELMEENNSLKHKAGYVIEQPSSKDNYELGA